MIRVIGEAWIVALLVASMTSRVFAGIGPPAAGDTCADALPALDGDNPFDTSANTDSGVAVEGHCSYMGEVSKDIWFARTFPADGTVTLSTCAAGSFDTSVVVYEGDAASCDSLTWIASNGDAEDDNACQDYHSEVVFVVTAGLHYFIRVGGYGAGEGGPGNLNVSLDPHVNPCNCPPDDVGCPYEYVPHNPFEIPGPIKLATDGIFAIWWDGDFDHVSDTPAMFAQLNSIRQDCLGNLGMEDPPNPAECFYYNVYIHHGAADDFPDWGNGQGTDSYCMPYLTLPNGLQTDEANLYHEGFHIFQYSATSSGFALSDASWYTETCAQWYMAENMPGSDSAFVEAGAILANPQLALWHSFDNEAPGDPTDWLYQVRQYGMHTLLYYLTDVVGVASAIITDGYYNGTELRPQAHLYTEIGGEILRGYFADWAAHNTGGLDYLTPAQVERALLEAEIYGDPDNLHPYVATVADNEIGAGWTYESCTGLPNCFAPRSWAYNVIRVTNTQAANYTFHLDGDPAGSEGAASHFEGRIVVMDDSEPTYFNLDMADEQTGECSVTVEATDTEVFLVVVSVPEHFTGNQTYGYSVQILPALCSCDCEEPPDSTVDAGDFLALLAQWGGSGPCDCEDPPDGAVDAGDFLALLAAWGSCQ